MKTFVLLALAGLQLTTALPSRHFARHGPGGDEEEPAANATAPVSSGKAAPAGCKKLAVDSDWPAPEAWTAAMPEVMPLGASASQKHPDYKLKAESYKDVEDAVKFAAKNNIKITVINSGHDFLGRNDAPSGLRLDVSGLQGIKPLVSFTPTREGAASPNPEGDAAITPMAGTQAAVTFGVGVATQPLNNELSKSKLLTIGAAHGSVSVAGGWGQAAGHSPFSQKFGLGVDNVLEYKVVTADGILKVANAVSNPDLFWALRGGGAGTFGVVVEATFKAHPDMKVSHIDYWVNSTEPDSDALWNAYAFLNKQFPEVNKKGMTGYYYQYESGINVKMMTNSENANEAAMNEIMKPIFDGLKTMPGLKPVAPIMRHFETFKSYFDDRFGSIEAMECMKRRVKRHGGEPMADAAPQGIVPLDSRLLGEEELAHPDLAAALRASNPGKAGASVGFMGLQGHLIGGGAAMKDNPETSVLPAWRKAYIHMIGMKTEANKGVDALRAISPKAGAYVNEAYLESADWKNTFWGVNYPRLSAIKSKYDPDMVFWTSPGINADLMEVRDGGRVCKVAASPQSLVAGSTNPKNDNQNPMSTAAGANNAEAPAGDDHAEAESCEAPAAAEPVQPGEEAGGMEGMDMGSAEGEAGHSHGAEEMTESPSDVEEAPEMEGMDMGSAEGEAGHSHGGMKRETAAEQGMSVELNLEQLAQTGGSEEEMAKMWELTQNMALEAQSPQVEKRAVTPAEQGMSVEVDLEQLAQTGASDEEMAKMWELAQNMALEAQTQTEQVEKRDTAAEQGMSVEVDLEQLAQTGASDEEMAKMWELAQNMALEAQTQTEQVEKRDTAAEQGMSVEVDLEQLAQTGASDEEMAKMWELAQNMALEAQTPQVEKREEAVQDMSVEIDLEALAQTGASEEEMDKMMQLAQSMAREASELQG
ncbi:hypothetical protein K402DRAFT_403914 [Aulographum hederae CBS 113979]|uniref:FAD-binding PCMH-type domain-containing protein n=1 Tax=Aulographum hederae CBS 113979 TaxID=1176131 RepID=A0A6G1H1Q0_9PEZI|nr:hypothetical protein K402DRAFT_403914 [Aulographum hederae CBS 113979]